jgi:hypothetical protein
MSFNSKFFKQGLRPLKNLLPDNLNKIFKKEGALFFEINKNWNRIIGDEFFNFSRPLKLKRSSDECLLIIQTDKKFTLEIDYLRDDIIEKINSFCGYNAVQKIKVISKDQQFSKNIKKEISKSLSEKIETITNPKLKEVFLKFKN